MFGTLETSRPGACVSLAGQWVCDLSGCSAIAAEWWPFPGLFVQGGVMIFWAT